MKSLLNPVELITTTNILHSFIAGRTVSKFTRNSKKLQTENRPPCKIKHKLFHMLCEKLLHYLSDNTEVQEDIGTLTIHSIIPAYRFEVF